MTEEIESKCLKKEKTIQRNPKEHELIMKARAGHFQHFQHLFSEVTSPYFFGIDPYPIWKEAHENKEC